MNVMVANFKDLAERPEFFGLRQDLVWLFSVIKPSFADDLSDDAEDVLIIYS